MGLSPKTYGKPATTQQETSNAEPSENKGLEMAAKVNDAIGIATDLTVNGTTGAQKLANSLSGANSEIINLGEKSIVKGLTVEGAGRVLGAAGTIYSAYKFAKNPTLGNGIETAVSAATLLVPGGGWAIGATYFLADVITQALTKKSIAEHIDSHSFSF